MIRHLPPELWAFDAEWIPDVASGRRVYDLPAEADDREVLDEMWERGGACDDDPRPFLKTVLCRVVSIAAVVRKQMPDGKVSLLLHALPQPGDEHLGEADLIGRFLEAVGRAKPQLVGFNSRSADLIILLQRALAHRLTLPEFCRRPPKPWEGMDYFARGSDAHLDLKEEFGGWGKATPSLHELATVCRIPGKIGLDAHSVVDLWLAGDVRRIVQYNECDALSTYLLWLRAALLTGHLSPDRHAREEQHLEELLTARAPLPGHEHLQTYLMAWQELRAM
jgi:hypothetical protein